MMNKTEKEKVERDIKENRRNRIQGVLESFVFGRLDFAGISSDEYKKALKEAVDKLEKIK